MNSRIETDGSGLGGFTVIAVDPLQQIAAGPPGHHGDGGRGDTAHADLRKTMPDHLGALLPPAGLLLAAHRGNPRPIAG
jgi:hypothetical protein